MEFDGLETVVANHQLARRMTDTSAQPLHLQLLPPDNPAIAQLAGKLKGESYEIFTRQPLSQHFFRQFLLTEDELEHYLFLKQAEGLSEVGNADERRQQAKDILDMFFNSTSADLGSAPVASETDNETKSGTNSRSTTPRARKKSKGNLPTYTQAERQASATALSAYHTEVKRTVQTISQRLQDESVDIPPEIFVELVGLVERRQRHDLYPRFLNSEPFIQYVRHREYAARGKVTINTFLTYRIVGRGAFGAVSAVSKNDTHVLYALKEMSKRQIKSQDCIHTALNERNILAEVDSPFLTRLRYAFQNDDSLFFVMDFCSGGDLKWHLRTTAPRDPVTKLNHFSEDVARFYVAETLLALEHLHGRGIVYRDLKPHNLLLNASGNVVLSDFGLAEKLSDHRSGKLHALAGTAGYWAPEVLMKVPYGTEADIWSFGILLYCFLVGERPKCKCKKDQWCTFVHTDEKTQETLARDQELAAYNYDMTLPEYLSPAAADLIRRCLEVDQEKRIRLNDIKSHQFFAPTNWKALSNLHIRPPYIPDASQVHADSLAEVGELETSKFKKTKLEQDDVDLFNSMDFYSEMLVQQEIAQALEKQGQRGSAVDVGDTDSNDGCCTIL